MLGDTKHGLWTSGPINLRGRVFRFFRRAVAIALGLAILSVGVAGDRDNIQLRQPAHGGLPASTPLMALCVNVNTVVAVGAYGLIRRLDTTNFATNDNDDQIPSPTDVTLTSISCGDNEPWLIAGHEGTILKSTDRGLKWIAIRASPDSNAILKIISLAGGAFMAVGANGLVLKSVDYGATWQSQQLTVDRQELTFDPHLFDVVQLSNGTLLAVGEAGYIFISENNGDSWKAIYSPYRGSLFSITAMQDELVVAAGMRGNVVRSDDHGLSWTRVPSDLSRSIFAMRPVSRGLYLFAGAQGLLMPVSSDLSKLTTGLVPDTLASQLHVADILYTGKREVYLATSGGLKHMVLDALPLGNMP